MWLAVGGMGRSLEKCLWRLHAKPSVGKACEAALTRARARTWEADLAFGICFSLFELILLSSLSFSLIKWLGLLDFSPYVFWQIL